MGKICTKLGLSNKISSAIFWILETELTTIVTLNPSLMRHMYISSANRHRIDNEIEKIRRNVLWTWTFFSSLSRSHALDSRQSSHYRHAAHDIDSCLSYKAFNCLDKIRQWRRSCAWSFLFFTFSQLHLFDSWFVLLFSLCKQLNILKLHRFVRA